MSSISQMIESEQNAWTRSEKYLQNMLFVLERLQATHPPEMAMLSETQKKIETIVYEQQKRLEQIHLYKGLEAFGNDRQNKHQVERMRGTNS